MNKQFALSFLTQICFQRIVWIFDGRFRWLQLHRHGKSVPIVACIDILVFDAATNKLVLFLFISLRSTYFQANLSKDLFRDVSHDWWAVLASQMLLLVQGFNLNSLWNNFLCLENLLHFSDNNVLVVFVPLQKISSGSLLNEVAIGKALAIDVFESICVQYELLVVSFERTCSFCIKLRIRVEFLQAIVLVVKNDNRDLQVGKPSQLVCFFY